MSTVRDMIRRKGGDVFSISSDVTVYEALTLMAQHNTGALMVVSANNKVEGILSERDCVRKVELEGKTAKGTLVREIMTSKVIYVEAGQQLEECMALMIDKNVRHLPLSTKMVLELILVIIREPNGISAIRRLRI